MNVWLKWPLTPAGRHLKKIKLNWISMTNNNTTISTARQDFFFSSFIPLQEGGLSCATTTRPALSEHDAELFPETVAVLHVARRLGNKKIITYIVWFSGREVLYNARRKWQRRKINKLQSAERRWLYTPRQVFQNVTSPEKMTYFKEGALNKYTNISPQQQ